MKAFYLCPAPEGTVLEPREVPVPQPKPGEIVVRVRAASLNRGELLAAHGHYRLAEPRPAGGDCAGEVHALGEGVTGFALGERVMGRARGCFAEYVALAVEQTLPVPQRLSWEQAAAVPLVFVTVYEILHLGALRAGETLLVTAASSGVGVGLIQAGRVMGARVIALSRSAQKLERLKALGLDAAIEVPAGRFAEKVLEATGGKGADLGVNLVGGTIFPELLRASANQGRIAIVGYVDRATRSEIDLDAVHAKRLRIYGVSNANLTAAERAQATRGFARELLPAFADGRITPLVDRVFAFEELPAAKAYVESDAQVGKVVVRMQ